MSQNGRTRVMSDCISASTQATRLVCARAKLNHVQQWFHMSLPSLIDQPDDLKKLCRQFHGQDLIAVDTEFVRERTYFPRLCLIQVAGPSAIACIDTLAIDDMSPLTSLLLDTTITKVLHAARQDFEIFVQLTGEVPAPVFDTQVAADLCGLGDQEGLAAVAFNPGVIHTDMLESCFGQNAASYPSPQSWAERAVPFLLELGASDNGRSVDAPN